jgi:hypothetical protein
MLLTALRRPPFGVETAAFERESVSVHVRLAWSAVVVAASAARAAADASETCGGPGHW